MRSIVTGATGFVGSRLYRRLAKERERVTAIVRSDSDQAARARLAASLEAARAADRLPGAAVSAPPAALAGDVSEPLFGLDAAALAALRREGVGEIWHAAANVSFTDVSNTALVDENVAGARNMLALARHLGAARVFYVSTAYAAGLRDGPIPEALHDPGGRFRNAYELSKCLSEHLVAETCSRWGIGYDIIRPSIVIGPLSTCATGGSRFGLYAVLKILWRAARAMRAAPRPVRVHYDAGATLNLLPVDWAVDAMAGIAALPSGAIHHLAARQPAALSTVLEAFSRHAKVAVPAAVSAPAADATPLERRLHVLLAHFRPYVLGAQGRQAFVARAFQGPLLAEETIDRYVDAFLDETRCGRRYRGVIEPRSMNRAAGPPMIRSVDQ